MEMESCVPPGFRFHPTEEELVGYYLKRKIHSLKIDLDVIIDIDLYKMEPWDIQARCNLGYAEQNEWYFFSHKDKKYPTGTRTNRATAAGFWKATGRDKAVLSKERIIGMRKTLVFYKGRAPNGRKSDWIMHEYRHQTSDHAPPQEEGWVVCRAFKKPTPNYRQGYEAWNHAYYLRNHNNNHNVSSSTLPSSMDLLITENHMMNNNPNINEASSSTFHHRFDHNNNSVQELVSDHIFSDVQLMNNELPKLDSPSSISANLATNKESLQQNTSNGINYEEFEEERSNNSGQYVDWKVLDSLLVSQLTDATTSFAQFSDLPSSINENYSEKENQNHHLLGCFREL